jgi:hypothetical protein
MQVKGLECATFDAYHIVRVWVHRVLKSSVTCCSLLYRDWIPIVGHCYHRAILVKNVIQGPLYCF